MKEYIVIGYPSTIGAIGSAVGKVTANSKEEALEMIDNKSIWYNYDAFDFDQKKYDRYKNDVYVSEIRFKNNEEVIK